MLFAIPYFLNVCLHVTHHLVLNQQTLLTPSLCELEILRDQLLVLFNFVNLLGFPLFVLALLHAWHILMYWIQMNNSKSTTQ